MAEQEVKQDAVDEASEQPDESAEATSDGFVARATVWIQEEGPWWLCSFVFHLVLVCSLALISGKIVEKIVDEAPSFEEAKIEKTDVPQDIERFDVGETPEEPTELNNDTLALEKPGSVAVDEKYYDDSATFTEAGGGVAATTNEPNLGGLGGFDIKGLASGPAVKGKGGVGVGVGGGTHAGSGGDGYGFGGRARIRAVRTMRRAIDAAGPPLWRSCLSSAPDKRTSRRAATDRPFAPALATWSTNRAKTATCASAARCTITDWLQSRCANATE
jgi:hypothetical protein